MAAAAAEFQGHLNAIKQIAQAFVQHYYSTYDSDRLKLSNLYRNTSILSFEGATFIGTENIMKKYQSLNFKKVAHKIISFDCQPSGSASGILVFVCGDLKVDDDQNGIKFSQVFHLLQTEPTQKNFYIFNDLFRINVG